MDQSTNGHSPRRTEHIFDVVIVGGGIVGGALATTLARAGIDVCVLERDTRYRDRNKGEAIVPWGWAELDRLGLTPVLDEVGGMVDPVWEFIDPDGSVRPVPVDQLHPDAPGSYTIGHPDSCEALAGAARRAGADVRYGAAAVTVAPGPEPTVTWTEDGREHQARTRLVIGADGRSSSVRRQLGITRHATERTHVVSSVLVEGTPEVGDHVRVVGGDERLLLVFPLAGDRTRLYLVSAEDNFSGVDGAGRLVSASQMGAAPEPQRWAGRPAGPCATFGGEDTWVDQPVVDGVVLVGDAAGYNSPIIGQGLSLALRDARLVSETLLAGERWTPDVFEAYVAERTERLRRVRFIAQLWARVRLAPDEDLLRLREHPLVPQVLVGVLAGFDGADPDLFTEETARELLFGRPIPGPVTTALAATAAG